MITKDGSNLKQQYRRVRLERRVEQLRRSQMHNMFKIGAQEFSLAFDFKLLGLSADLLQDSLQEVIRELFLEYSECYT